MWLMVLLWVGAAVAATLVLLQVLYLVVRTAVRDGVLAADEVRGRRGERPDGMRLALDEARRLSSRIEERD